MNSLFLIFKNYPGLTAAVSTKQAGNMRINSADKNTPDKNIKNNRSAFFRQNHINPDLVVSPVLEHGISMAEVGQESAGRIIKNADGLITNQSGIFLSLTVADCLPVFLFDPKEKVIALVHAGWRGLAGGILNNAINKFTLNYGCKPQNILAGIGPGICQKHFEVKNDVAGEFSDYPGAVARAGDKMFLDLKQIARLKLLNLGLSSTNIETNCECTYELPEKYFSFRRDKPVQVEAMVSVFGML